MAKGERRARRKANVLPFVPKAIPLALSLCFSSAVYAAQCTPGNWSFSGSDPCNAADAGYFVAITGATAETQCFAGSYQPATGQTACIAASPGTFTPGASTGNTAATLCSPGFYQPASNATECSTSQPGPGFFVGVSGASAPTPAPAGFFVDTPGATTPSACLGGFYQPATGATECSTLKAPAGSFTTGGASQPTSCPAGTFQPASGQTTCGPVPAGSFSNGGASQPTPCVTGFFQGLSGQSACNPADMGSFAVGPGATAEQACLPGSFQSLTGQSDCSNTQPGTFVAGNGATSPTLCSPGFYQSAIGTTICATPAPAGSFVGSAGQSAASLCLPGSYQPATGMSACIPAGAGFFVSVSGATGETACAAGTTSSLGATQCSIIQYSLSIAKSGTGTGTVTSAPAGINCGAACLGNFDTGTSIALTATAGANSIFSGWSGSCTGSTACNVTMDSPKSVTADFEPTTSIPRLGNISTRMDVLTGDNVMIAGFIIGGSTPKTLAITATGPSLVPFGISNPLPNPSLTLVRQSDHAVIATNDDWQSDANASLLQSTGFAPTDPHEAGLYVTLPPGAYTAIVSDPSGAAGVSVVGAFEVDHPEIPLINISTRGFVQTGNNVMIAGVIVQGSGPQTVVITATGPSLVPFGITNPLGNPTLTLVRQSDHVVIGTNDDWQTNANAAQITASGFAPTDPHESALMVTLDPGAYTAIVQDAGGGSGVSVVGVFTVP